MSEVPLCIKRSRQHLFLFQLIHNFVAGCGAMVVLNPQPYTQYPSPHPPSTLDPTPNTFHPTRYILDPTPLTLHPGP